MVVRGYEKELEALRACGVKRAVFSGSVLVEVEFFDAAPPAPSGEDIEKALAGEPEVPGGFVHAASILLSKSQGAKQ